MGLFGLDPQQVGTVLQAGDAVQDAAVLAGAGAELEQVGGQAFGPQQLAVAVDDDVAVRQLIRRDLLAVQEAVVLVAQVARRVRDGDLLG